jgi:UDP-GlcNAc:undecaprenyl-phosphate/decaprenyl-phosphate GlcNAc-1-phosphate transferase
MQQIIIAAAFLMMTCPIIWRCVRAMLRWKGMLRENYSGDSVIIGSGLLLPVVLLIYAIIVPGPEVIRFAIAVSLVAGIGWLDDTLGDRQVKGLRGHLKAWTQEGRWTTGLLKLTGITTVAFILTVLHRPAWQILPTALLLPPLSANAVNLLDVRPGRALKAVIAAMAGLMLFDLGLALLLPVMVTAVYLLPKDLKKEAMLGDTGANAFGFAMGYGLACYANTALQWSVFIMLLYLHYLAEKESMTARIERSRWLSWLDRLGRV